MADLPSESSNLRSSFAELARAIRDLVRLVKGSARPHGSSPDPPQDQPPPPPALPPGEAHAEAAQLLTQRTPGWHLPMPSTLPVPTYAPATTAFGIVFIALGAVTLWPLSVIGVLIFVFGLSQWIGDLLP